MSRWLVISLLWLSAAMLGETSTVLAGEEADAACTVRVKSRDELIQAVRAAQPGSRILLEPGHYAGGLSFAGLQGTKERPIAIGAVDPNKPAVIEGGGVGLHLSDPAYIELFDLVITKARANGLNIDDGGSVETPAHHVVLRRLVVRDNGSEANHDGLKLSGLDDFIIEDCTIERWGKRGSGIDMVGCHGGKVMGCTIREGDKTQANGIQMKGGSRGITVSRCRFEDAGGRGVNLGGSTGLPYFRPKPEGYEAKDISVEDCVFTGSMAPVAFVGVDGAQVSHNVFFRPTRWVLRILQENQAPEFVPCRKGEFHNNIVVFRTDEVGAVVNIGGKTSPETFSFEENFWYCEDRPERTLRAVQLPAMEKEGVYGQDPQFKDAAKGDFQLKSGSPAAGAGPRRE